MNRSHAHSIPAARELRRTATANLNERQVVPRGRRRTLRRQTPFQSPL